MHHRSARLAVVLLGMEVLAGPTVAGADAASPGAGAGSSGAFIRASGNQSVNWSGYAEPGSFASIGGSWTVPAVAATAGATTYAIGKVFVRHLESGGSLLTFDGKKMKGYMEKALDEGKKRMPRWNKRAPDATDPDPAAAI